MRTLSQAAIQTRCIRDRPVAITFGADGAEGVTYHIPHVPLDWT
ncbi:MAG: hypothetical protein QOC56_594, partial [Alphaproteobacteria bacterium]|nr:hypothetical protein [Alphaproteobacteria bacterium]